MQERLGRLDQLGSSITLAEYQETLLEIVREAGAERLDERWEHLLPILQPRSRSEAKRYLEQISRETEQELLGVKREWRGEHQTPSAARVRYRAAMEELYHRRASISAAESAEEVRRIVQRYIEERAREVSEEFFKETFAERKAVPREEYEAMWDGVMREVYVEVHREVRGTEPVDAEVERFIQGERARLKAERERRSAEIMEQAKEKLRTGLQAISEKSRNDGGPFLDDALIDEAVAECERIFRKHSPMALELGWERGQEAITAVVADEMGQWLRERLGIPEPLVVM
jgi:hypothetical protein